MLVLSRKENEKIVIDGNIVVQIVRVAGGKVSIGITAPLEVKIQREELLYREAPPRRERKSDLLVGAAN